MPSSERPGHARSMSTRLLISFIVLVGVSALGFGVASIRKQITSPFVFSPLEGVATELSLPRSADLQAAEQRTMDTDKDGLNDFDEINLYGTSPYIADSDSDGLSDQNEVESGTDPNCPRGEDCRVVRLITPDTKISDLFPQFSDSRVTLKEKTVEEFKKIIVDQGFDAGKLAELDNDVLLIILEESLKYQDEQLAQATTPPVIGEEIDLDKVRLFLIELGVPSDEVYSMSNDEIAELLRTLR